MVSLKEKIDVKVEAYNMPKNAAIVVNPYSPESVIMGALLRHSKIFKDGDVRWIDSRRMRELPIMNEITDYYWCDVVPGDQIRNDLDKLKNVDHHYNNDDSHLESNHMPITPLSVVIQDIRDTLTEVGWNRALALADIFALLRKGGSPSLVSLATVMTNQISAYNALTATDRRYEMTEMPSTKDHITLKKLPQAEYYKLPEIELFLNNTAKNKRNLSSNLRITKFGNKEAAISAVHPEDAFWVIKLMKQRFPMGLVYDFTLDRLFISAWGMTQKEISETLLNMKKFYGVLDSVVEIGVA